MAFARVGRVKSTEEEEAKVSNKEVFKTLQKHASWGAFFVTFGDGEDCIGKLVKGRKFAEGGQAEIFEVEVHWRPQNWVDLLKCEGINTCPHDYVLKVFKKGTFLRDMENWWPKGMLQFHGKKKDVWRTRRYNCDVVCGTLLADGEFAFLLQREQEDLRSLIDRKMMMKTWRPSTIVNRLQHHGPFPKDLAEKLIYEIALGVNWLHEHEIIHRDLKAANVLVSEDKDQYYCFVADYECSHASCGTLFFRAPEILQAVNAKNVQKRQDLFTKEADAYSFGMTCYEILTGKHPFEDLQNIGHSRDLVINGHRPEVPTYVDDWMRVLLTRCWEDDLARRPSFQDILNLLSEKSAVCCGNDGVDEGMVDANAHWSLTKTEVLSHSELLTMIKRAKHEEIPYWDQLVSSFSIVEEENSDSKVYWSELAECSDDEEADVDAANYKEFMSLHLHPTFRSFFQIFPRGGLLVGEKFAEGGQAELFEVQVKTWPDQFHHDKFVLNTLCESEYVLKVFKKGTFVKHLIPMIPRGLLQFHVERIEAAAAEPTAAWKKPVHTTDILCATLLDNRRFAFLLEKGQVNLRWEIERCIQTSDQGCGPFPKEVAKRMMHHIALGIDWIHSYGIVHRDLKASNVLIRTNPDGSCQYLVADYEVSVGVVGTGFFRAPEVLEACRSGYVSERPEVFSKAADIYGYGMVCYEILTGNLPFENHPLNDNRLLIDLVINQHLRPEVPEYVDDWARELLNMCWRCDPVRRPSIHEILNLLSENGTSIWGDTYMDTGLEPETELS